VTVARSILLLVAALCLVGCGRRDSDPESGPGAGRSGGTTGATRPGGRFSRANYRKVMEKHHNGLGTPVRDVEKLFGPPAKIEARGDGKAKYTWTGDTKDEWFSAFVNGKYVEQTDWPGKSADDSRRGAFAGAAEPLTVHLRNYALAHRSKLPARLDDLAGLKAKLPKAYELLQSGEIVVPWGKSANCLLWAWWKDTPETGGPYVRFDSKRYDCTTAQFAKLRDTALTSATIPADLVDPKEPRPPRGNNSGKGPPAGFWMCDGLLSMIAPMKPDNPPTSLDEFPKFMVRSNSAKWALSALEKKEVVLRWGKPPGEGVWAYPAEFPKAGGWAIVKGERREYTADEAAKLLAGP
jgi:hypothetical protein